MGAPAEGAVAQGPGAPSGSDGAGADGQPQGWFDSLLGSGMQRFMLQMMMISLAMNMMTQRRAPPGGEVVPSTPGDPEGPVTGGRTKLANLYGPVEECELFIHLGLPAKAPGLEEVLDRARAAEQGLELVWQQRVWYSADAELAGVNLTVGPLPPEVLSGNATLHLHATMLRASVLGGDSAVSPQEVVQETLPLLARLRELNTEAGAENLFTAASAPGAASVRPAKSRKVPYFKSRLEIRPVVDQTVHSTQTILQGPFRRLKTLPDLGVYQPFLYVSDFWLLEKDYVPLNETLAGRRLNLTLSYGPISLWAWSLQAQLMDQWATQNENDWGLTDPQRDAFMVKRLLTDTNPYFLAFSAAFILLHTVFSLLAFKNDIQFWRKNESMQGLSARSMCISWVCNLITALYLLDSQETSRLILFEILLSFSLETWKLRKAVKVELQPAFPFVTFGGQPGYDETGTSQYDKEAIKYMGAIMTPVFLIYAGHSMIYGKHRGWYSYLVGTAAGGVYTFGFVMMTPQLYINYKLQSVEHLPWRALTYKALNTFVDDIAALLIDMPLMHRLSCFRDDVVFFIYIYQRWKYRVDRTRTPAWAAGDADGQVQDAPAALPGAQDSTVEGAKHEAASSTENSASGGTGAEPGD